MSEIEIANLQHASRAAAAWSPEGYDGRTHYAALLIGVVPALGIIAAAAAFLMAIAG